MCNYLNSNLDLNKLPEVYDDLPFWSAPFGLKLLDVIDYKTNISALDIGFGNGFPLIELAMRLGQESKVFGIDSWGLTFKRIYNKLEYFNINNITLIEESAEDIPLANNSIDLIVSNNGINNANDFEKVIFECSRVIKPNGQFVMTMNLADTMLEFYNVLEVILKEMGLHENIELMYKHIYSKRKPINEIITILNNANFIIKEKNEDTFTYKFSNGSAFLNHSFIRLAFINSWVEILPFHLVRSIFEIIEQRLNEIAIKKNGITITIPFITIDSFKKS